MSLSRQLPLISIVTPSFNQGQYIGQTIRSVLDQGYSRLQLIVVDGGSTDTTLDVLRRFGGDIQWISEPDRGQSDAINKGLRLATGDVLTYLNSDDLLMPGSLQAVADYFLNNPEVEWVTGYCRNIDENNKVVQSAITSYKNFLLRHYHHSLLVGINFISQMSTFWRRSAMESIGLFDEKMHLVMDYDYWLRLAQRNAPGIIRQELGAFRLHPESKSTKRMVEQFRQSAELAIGSVRNPWLKTFSYAHHYAVIAAYRLLHIR